jgi:hypothetical protein
MWNSVLLLILKSESRGTYDHILLSHIRDSPYLKGQVPVFISPSHKVARLYLQTLGSLSVASFNLQGYGGGIRPRLHTGMHWLMAVFPSFIHSPCADSQITQFPAVLSLVACHGMTYSIVASPFTVP